jgi:hypothetical protein
LYAVLFSLRYFNEKGLTSIEKHRLSTEKCVNNAANNVKATVADREAAWLKLSLLSHGVSFRQSIAVSPSRSESRHVTRLNVYNSPIWNGTTCSLPQEVRLSDHVVCAVNVYGTNSWEMTEGLSAYRLFNAYHGVNVEVEGIPQLKSYELHPELRGTSNLYGGSAIAYFTPRGCVYFSDGSECRFCSLQGTASSTAGIPARLTAGAIAQNLRAILEYDAARLNQVMIVGGTSRDLDHEFLDYVAIAHAVADTLAHVGLTDQVSIHLATMPPSDQALISELRGIANLHVMFNLEVWDEQRFADIAPGKAKYYGRSRLLSALDRLVATIGEHHAHSLLIGGLEPASVTYSGGRELAKRGISVINNIFHSDRYSNIGLAIRPTTEELWKLASLVQDLYDEYPLEPYWKGCGRNAIDYEACLGCYRSLPNTTFP